MSRGKKQTGGGKLARSEVVTVRLDSRLRYLAELAARKQRRTVSSFIEWAVEESLRRISLHSASGYVDADNPSIVEDSIRLWDIEEADRFAWLAFRHSDLLTYDEQILWKSLQENGYIWRGRYDKNGRWVWKVGPDSLIYQRLREYWDGFVLWARGERSKAVWPFWQSTGDPSATDHDFEVALDKDTMEFAEEERLRRLSSKPTEARK
jgi:hypothetical protein